MEISLEKKSETFAIINLQITEADYQADFTTKLKDYAKKANFKGFRPGKVPFGMVKKMMGADVKGQLINELISSNVSKYLREEKIDIFFYPMLTSDAIVPEKIMETKDFTATFDVCLRPELNLEKLSEIEIENFEVEVSDKEIEDYIQKYRDAYAEVLEKEEVEEGSFIDGNFKSKDFEKKTVLPLNQIDEDYKETFIGKKKDETFTFEIEKAFKEDTTKKVKLLFGTSDEETDKIKGEIELKIEKITNHSPAELNEEFFTKVLGKDKAKTEEEFKEGVKALMKSQSEAESNVFFGRNMTEILRDSFNVPAFEEEILSKVLNENKESLGAEYNEEEEIEKLVKHLKWDTISKQIFKEGELKLEEADIDAAATSLAKAQLWSMGLNTDEFVDMIKHQMLNGENADDKTRQEIYDEAFFIKLSSYIKEKANVKTTKVGVEELREKFKKFDAPEQEVAEVEEV